jgi:hypothetical protein
MNKNTVTLSVNIFERTYNNIFKKDFFKNIEDKFNYKFDQIHVTINNVNYRDKVEKKVLRLRDKGIITNFYFVEDYIDKALKNFGIGYDVLGKIPHYSDFLYVSIFVTQTKFLCYFDPDNTILKEGPWIRDSIHLLNKNKSIMATAPTHGKFCPPEDVLFENQKFYFYYTFTDQIFFIRKKDFSRDIYYYKTLSSFARYPLAYIFPVFEQRVDSYMRFKNKNFAYHKESHYSQTNEGLFYRKDMTSVYKLKRLYQKGLRPTLELLKIKNPKYRIHGNLDIISRRNIIKKEFKGFCDKHFRAGGNL